MPWGAQQPFVRRCDVTSSRPGVHSSLRQKNAQFVHRTVAPHRNETEHVLAVKFLSDPRERRAKLVGCMQFEVPSACLLRKFSQIPVRPTAYRPGTAEEIALEANRVDHHIVINRPVEDISPANVAAGVIPVRKDEDDSTTLDSVQCGQARFDRIVESGWIAEVERGELVDEEIAVVCKLAGKI